MSAGHSAAKQTGITECFHLAKRLALQDQNAERLREAGELRPLSECLAEAETDAGGKRVASLLESQPFLHFEPVPSARGLFVRIDEDGTRTKGRFVGREFRAAE